MNAAHVEIGRFITLNLKVKSLIFSYSTESRDSALMADMTVFKLNQMRPVQCGSLSLIKKESCLFFMMGEMTISQFLPLVSIANAKKTINL